MALEVGSRLGHYDVTALIGIWRCHSPGRRPIAIVSLVPSRCTLIVSDRHSERSPPI